MESINYFMIIVNGWTTLTLITKHSILDVAAALDPPLILAKRPILDVWQGFKDDYEPVSKYMQEGHEYSKNLLCYSTMKRMPLILIINDSKKVINLNIIFSWKTL